MAKSELNITGMTCNHCVAKVEEAARAVLGVEKVKVNLKKGLGKVKFDETQTSAEQIAVAITEVGYAATVK
jgi:copper chaperone